MVDGFIVGRTVNKGIVCEGQKFRAQYRVNKKLVYLGLYNTEAKAVAAMRAFIQDFLTDPTAAIAKVKHKLPRHGVTFTPSGRWQVRIRANKLDVHVGVYSTLAEAIKARHDRMG